MSFWWSNSGLLNATSDTSTDLKAKLSVNYRNCTLPCRPDGRAVAAALSRSDVPDVRAAVRSHSSTAIKIRQLDPMHRTDGIMRAIRVLLGDSVSLCMFAGMSIGSSVFNLSGYPISHGWCMVCRLSRYLISCAIYIY